MCSYKNFQCFGINSLIFSVSPWFRNVLKQHAIKQIPMAIFSNSSQSKELASLHEALNDSTRVVFSCRLLFGVGSGIGTFKSLLSLSPSSPVYVLEEEKNAWKEWGEERKRGRSLVQMQREERGAEREREAKERNVVPVCTAWEWSFTRV